MNLISTAAAAILVMASLNEAAPTTKPVKRANQLPGLENIKHVVYFMQVCLFLSFNMSHMLISLFFPGKSLV